MKLTVLTIEERTWIKEAVILTFVLEVLDLERKRTENSLNILRAAHLETLEAVFDLAHAELIGIKKDLKSREIKYIDGIRDDFILRYDIWARGYKTWFGITRDHAKSELQVKLGQLSGIVEAQMKKRPTRR